MNKEFIILAWGAIGDAVICTPTLKALKQTYPDRKIILYCGQNNQMEVFRNNPYVDSLRFLSIKHLWRYPRHLYAFLFNRKKVPYTVLRFQHIIPTFLYEKSIKEIVADIFDLKLQDKNTQIFFSEKEEEKARERLAPYRNVVIMHIHSRSSSNHHWPPDRWQELVRQLPEYTFIQLGEPDELLVEGAVDWRGKTGLREAFALLKYADSFIGVDSSMSHVTNAFGIPGVVLFGDSSPVYWGHDNNTNLYKKVRCSPCYYHLWADSCPYGHECMDLITVEEVRQALVAQMNKRMAGKASPVPVLAG
jgi:ADP-heptose:LPS heptosyltransferase